MANPVTALNITKFLKRPIYIYGVGDIALKKPIRFNQVLFTALFLAIWVVPLYLIFGLPTLNRTGVFILLFFYLAPPIALGNLVNKDIFLGKNLFEFISTWIQYSREPGAWNDYISDSSTPKSYRVMQEIGLSRRFDYEMLVDIIVGKARVVEKETEMTPARVIVPERTDEMIRRKFFFNREQADRDAIEDALESHNHKQKAVAQEVLEVK